MIKERLDVLLKFFSHDFQALLSLFIVESSYNPLDKHKNLILLCREYSSLFYHLNFYTLFLQLQTLAFLLYALLFLRKIHDMALLE